MRLYPSPLIALGILHQVEIFLHEIGVDEFQPDLLLMAFVFRVVGSSMAESSRCFQNCSRNSVCRLILLSLAFTHCRELMKSVGKLS
jgi:hypothetical protein